MKAGMHVPDHKHERIYWQVCVQKRHVQPRRRHNSRQVVNTKSRQSAKEHTETGGLHIKQQSCKAERSNRHRMHSVSLRCSGLECHLAGSNNLNASTAAAGCLLPQPPRPAHDGTLPCAPANAHGCMPCCSSARRSSRRSGAGRWWRRSRGRHRCGAQVTA